MAYLTSMYGAMTIRDILDALSDLPNDHTTSYGWDECYSYRGYYEELAVNTASVSIVVMRHVLQDAVGRTFHGYKGGDFTMTEHTGVWRAEYGDTGHPITPDTIQLIRQGAT